MHDDDATRPVRAVKKRIEDQETKLRPAVARRRQVTPQLLPYALSSAETIHCVESSRFTKGTFSANSYRFEPGGLTAHAPWRLLFHRWRYDFVDDAGKLRFWFERGLKRLVLNQLEVFDGSDTLLGRFEQRLTGMSVHFDVFDADGAPRFALQQPADTYASYFATYEGTELGRISPDGIEWDGSVRQAMTLQDAVRVDLNAQTEELDRVLLIAGAVFMDRVYSTGKQE